MEDLPPFNPAEIPCILLHQTGTTYWQIYSLSIEHTCLEYCYTTFGRSTARWTPSPFNHRSMLYCYIQEVSHITECTYTHDRLIPLPINDTPMLHHYTFPYQLTIDPCYAVTPISLT